jgi:hypothetical protein
LAQNVAVLLTCDLCEDTALAVETVKFSSDGVEYETEMCQTHLEEYLGWMEEHIAAARKLGSLPTTSKEQIPATKGTLDLKAVRSWAKENGFSISSRGRVPASITDAYTAAAG